MKSAMFKIVPNIKNTQIFLKDRVFNINIELTDTLSTVRNTLTKFGVLITESDKKLPNYKASYTEVNGNNSKVVFLSANSQYSISQQNISCNLMLHLNYDNNQKNKIVYVTPFYYQEEFENLNNNIVYTFSNTQEIELIKNDILNSKILNYHIIDEINNLNLNLLSQNINYDYGISELYTSFTDRYKTSNYFFVNHSILSKFQKEKISNIMNYNSTIIKNLLRPKIKITNKKQNFDITYQKIQQVNYVQFSDEVRDLTDCQYKLQISYDFSSIHSLFSELIQTYKNK